ncbi:MAG: mechanosensitive ion channel family protein [Ardenticatenaceae bacterium]|nr:mechanosensitive ion channel family protein [Ardenticatenaceae bacterium]
MTPFLTTLSIASGFVLGGLLIGYLLRLILSRYGRKLSQKTTTNLDNVFIDVVLFPVQAISFILGLQLAVRQFVVPESWWNVISALFFVSYWIIATISLYRLVDRVFHWYEDEIAHKTETELDDKFLNLFRRLALMILLVVVFITLLGRFDIEVGALLTSLGVGSLAVALAAQDSLGNLFAGLTIMIDQPFKVGDRVELQEIETWGDVVEIGLRSTRIRTRDNRMVTVPNAVIGNGLIVNYSDPDTVFRVETMIGVAYGTDIEFARQVMIDAIYAEPWVMKEERIEALFLEFGESALNFRVRCWIEDYIETRRIIDKMNSALYKALNEVNIEMPFPQRDLHLVSSNISLGTNGS